MQIHYEITIDDLKAVHRAGMRHSPRTKNGRRGLVGWFLFIGLVLMMVYLLNNQKAATVATPATPPPAASSPSDHLTEILYPLLPWVLLVAFIWFVFVRRLPGFVFKKHPELGKLIVLEITGDGIFMSTGPSQTRWQWPAFDRVIEMPTTFLLRLTNTRSFVIIPRRAIVGPAELEQLKSLLKNISDAPATAAFPVIPLSEAQMPRDHE